PHTDATVPCIHDLYAKARTVTLVHGEEFAGLAATWKSEEQGVAITNVPPVSAEIHGSFPKNQTRTICYTMSHPDYMAGETNYVQTLRFCPKLPESDDLDDPPDEEEEPYYICDCGTGGTCSCCTGEWCHCTCWDCPCNQNQSPTLGDSDEEAEEAYTNIVSGALQPLANTLYLYRANTRAEHLGVPTGAPVKCCPCPDHCKSNYVAKAFCSRRLAVDYAGGGEEFRISYNPCDVAVSGVSPSRAFSDASVLFVTNGTTYKVQNYTVLGVRFESEYGRASLSNYNHRSASLGYPVSVCTNLDNAASIVMKTDVLLADGFVRLSMEDASGDIALWLPAWWDSHGTWHPAEPLLQSDGVAVRYMTIRRWRNIIRRYNIQNAIEARIVSSRPSSCRLRLDFVASNGEGYVHDFAAQRISAVKPPLLPDYNRDMMADIKDVIDMGNQRLLYFWANRDIWQGDDAFDRYSHFYLTEPDFPGNCEDMVVNGRNDLVNLCPFAVDLSTFVRKWGTAGVRYEFYSGRPDEVHFVPVDIGWRALDKMVMEDGQTVFGDDLHSATLLKNSVGQSGEVGYALPQQLLSLGESESGCLALEFASTGLITPRIRICDEESGETLFETAVAVRVLDVHRMYRWLNLEYACDVTLDAKYNDRLTVDWPDNEHSDANVVFVHGYNMHPSETWEWSQAMFKRLWWSGMDAGFTAVEWHGNHSQLWIPKIPLVTDGSCYGTLNYHQNVLNAFRTASTFASRVNGLPGARKYMIAHSLGNMLVSAARQDYGLQYDKYFMLNAAVAVEAYDPVGGVTEDSRRDMTPLAWRPYSNRVRPTHWYELFLSNPNDERRNLTWKGRFRDVDNTINFYSSKDEVVANGDEDVKELVSRKFAWYNQEQKKGVFLVSASPQAGWKFSDHYIVQRDTGRWENGAPIYDYRKYTPEETSAIADTNLMVRPFFRDFRDTQIYGEGGSEFLLANENVRWYALSHGIPAESFAAGANPVPNWSTEGRNVDMAKECNPKAVSPGGAQVELDTEDDDEGMVNWIHSYFIGKSLFDTKLLYEKLVGHIGSTKPKERVDNE
ncbi:MAG: hypothetical protein IKQ17_02790, partial [Kiritimatiellae bacterium]|nr:hypothetical protein [Kiritimatiellia bacterium]